MTLLGNFLQALAQLLDTLLWLYMLLIIVSAVLSWVSPDPYNPIVRFIRTLTEPVLRRVRNWLPFGVVGGIDLTPILVILGIMFIRVFLVQSLMQLSMQV